MGHAENLYMWPYKYSSQQSPVYCLVKGGCFVKKTPWVSEQFRKHKLHLCVCMCCGGGGGGIGEGVLQLCLKITDTEKKFLGDVFESH